VVLDTALTGEVMTSRVESGYVENWPYFLEPVLTIPVLEVSWGWWSEN